MTDSTTTATETQTRPVRSGDWVNITRAPYGTATHVRSAHAAKLEEIYMGGGTVALYNQRGHVTRHLNVPVANLQVAQEPTWQTATSHIPETPEVIAARDLIYEHAMVVGRRSGMCSVLNDALEELGIHKPPSGKVKATLVFEVETTPEDLVRYTTYRSIEPELARLSTRELARLLMGRADYDAAKVDYKVFEPDRKIGVVATPSPAPAPIDIANHNDVDDDDDEEDE